MNNFNWNKYWWKWTLACVGGEIIGIGAAAMLAGVMIYFIGEPVQIIQKGLLFLTMIVSGIIEGSILGLFQWRILEQLFPKIPPSRWIYATITAAVIGWMIGALPSVFFMDTIQESAMTEPISPWLNIFAGMGAGILLGTLMGFFQQRVLKDYVQRSESWILANALGWGFGIVWIFIAASIPSATTPIIVIVFLGIAGGLSTGIFVGAITGWFLVRLPYLQPTEEEKIQILSNGQSSE